MGRYPNSLRAPHKIDSNNVEICLACPLARFGLDCLYAIRDAGGPLPKVANLCPIWVREQATKDRAEAAYRKRHPTRPKTSRSSPRRRRALGPAHCDRCRDEDGSKIRGLCLPCYKLALTRGELENWPKRA